MLDVYFQQYEEYVVRGSYTRHQEETSDICSLCNGRPVRPKILSCRHSFCESCLRRQVTAASLSTACPTCCQLSILPESGVGGLSEASQGSRASQMTSRYRALGDIQRRLHNLGSTTGCPSPFWEERRSDSAHSSLKENHISIKKDYHINGSLRMSSELPKNGFQLMKGNSGDSAMYSATLPSRSEPLVIGKRGRAKGEMTNPQGVAVTSSGELLVADSNNQCVQLFDQDANCLKRFGNKKGLPSQFMSPVGITTMANDRIIVSDYDNKWLTVFDQNGKVIKRFGKGKFLGPKGVAVDQRGFILVADARAHCVHLLDSSGALLRKLGEGLLSGPQHVTTTPHRQLLVTDFHHHCVYAFDWDGRQVGSFGGPLRSPTGLAIDGEDTVLIADWGNNCVQKFNANGKWQGTLQSPALFGPQGLAVAEDSRMLLVADSGHHCCRLLPLDTN